MTIEKPASSEAESLLRQNGLPDHPIVLAGGFANEVWLTLDHVVRLNNGRFRDAFRHEAEVLRRLPSDIPHPKVVAHGLRIDGGEYLILERMAGTNLERAWSTLSRSDRATIVDKIGDVIQKLHTIEIAGWMRNPWVEDAIAHGNCRDAYHAPPEFYPTLIESASNEREDAGPVLTILDEFMASRMSAFGHERDVLVHADLHFRNVLVSNGHVTGLIDYEGCRPAPLDVELDMLLRSLSRDSESDTNMYPGVVGSLKRKYPALFAHPQLLDRLEVYEGLWHLVQLHHWRPGHIWTIDPIIALQRLLDGSFRERVGQVLEESPLN